MVLFRRGHEMPASPLLSAVPLDGTDTVVGLRVLEQTVPALAQRQSFSETRRYRGPYLEHLTTDHITAPPKPWKEFFEGQDGWKGAYNVPQDWHRLFDRAEENLMRFLPNYLRVMFACFACIMYTSPLALVGLVLMFLIWDYMRSYTAERHLGQDSLEYKAIYICAHIAMWVVALKSRGMLALSKGALLSAVLIGLHAAAKVAPAELRTQRTGLARLFSRSRGYKDQRQGPGSLRNLATLTGLLQLRAWWEDLWWMLRGAAEDTYWQFVDKVAMRRGTAARR